MEEQTNMMRPENEHEEINLEPNMEPVESESDGEMAQPEISDVKSPERAFEIPDFSKFTLAEMVSETNRIINELSVAQGKKLIEVIKSAFYIKLNAEQDAHKSQYVEAGHDINTYQVPVYPDEETLKELLKVYKAKKADALAASEKLLEQNFKDKSEIIIDISLLESTTAHFNTIYQKFKSLQDKWREVGPVSTSKQKELNAKYQFALNKFYEYLKINKELRDLDLKKNQELKEAICLRSEQLLDSETAKTAFLELQNLHQKWKEIGPVLEEHREDLWSRFKIATKSINDKFQDYQTQIKQSREENLNRKTEISTEVEAIVSRTFDMPKDWDEASTLIDNFQKEWRKIGMVPSKINDEVYTRFKTACDGFFHQKNEYYKDLKDGHRQNLEEKMKLIEMVEALKDSEDWKDSSEKIIKIQKDWRLIGPVNRKKSDQIWKQFRAACDTFFERKEAHFKTQKVDEVENLQKKLTLIDEIEKYVHKEDVGQSIQDLKAFQNRWAEIGYVPAKQKNEIQDRYRTAINKQFDALDVDSKERDLSRLKVKLDGFIDSPNAKKMIFGERNKLVLRLRQVEADIQQLENNIGFFASGTAKGLLKEYENKILVNKKNLKDLQDKIRLIDKYIG